MFDPNQNRVLDAHVRDFEMWRVMQRLLKTIRDMQMKLWVSRLGSEFDL